MWAWISSKLVAEMTEPIPAAAGEGLGMGCPFSRSPREASLPVPPIGVGTGSWLGFLVVPNPSPERVMG